MALRFDVASSFNFQNYQYMLVLNTSGNGASPSTDTLQTNWAGYSFALIAGGSGGTTFAKPVQLLRNSNPHIPPAWLPLGTTPQQFSYNPNSNGSGTEFSMLFQQRIFVGASPQPTPSGTGTAPPFAQVWKFNAFTAQAVSGGQWTFLDSLGAGGPVDPQFVSPGVCITEPFDNTYYAYFMPSDPAAQIVSIEFSNNPVNPKPCT